MTSMETVVGVSYFLYHYSIYEYYQNDESTDNNKLCNEKYSKLIPKEDWTPDSPIPYDFAGK